MFKYEIKKGHENRVFANTRRISETEVESDEELNSVYLTPVNAETPAAPATPVATPQLPPQQLPPQPPAATPAPVAGTQPIQQPQQEGSI